MKCIASELDDESFDRVLRNIRNVLTQGNKLYLIDLVMDRSHHYYRTERYRDIMFWNLVDGKVRTREELETILERNGFRINKLTPAKTDFVIEVVVV